MKRFRSLFVLFLVALLAPILATESPLLVIEKGSWSFPFMHSMDGDWNSTLLLKNSASSSVVLKAPVPYSPGKSDYLNSGFASPFHYQYYLDGNGDKQILPLRFHHFLGTDLRGSDVLSGLIHGLRITFWVGILSTLISLIIAFFSGVISGWFAGGGFKMTRMDLLLALFLIVELIVVAQNANYSSATFDFILIPALCILFFFLRNILQSNSFWSGKISFPIDSFFTRINEVLSTFPRFVLVVAIAGFFEPSLLQVVLVLGLTGWTDLARILRSEIVRLKEQSFIDAGRISGAGDIRLLLRHVLPNAWPVFSVSILFTLAFNILLEAGLSFLGIGLSGDYVSLGGMLAQGKDHLEAWWLVVCPGLLLSFTLYKIYQAADDFRLGKANQTG